MQRPTCFFYKGGAPPVKKIALTHMAINLIVVVLYAVNIGLRASGLLATSTGFSIPILLSIIGGHAVRIRLARRSDGARVGVEGRD